jgi:hypothetical protein
LISVSIQDIRQNPQDTSNFYLANIYQATINPGAHNSSSSPPTFSPPNHAIWVNALWFLSLVISLTCALLATLLQQWARRYLKITQPRYSPHKRARIRAFFSEGVEKCLLPWIVETLPTLLHISLFLFFAGLVVFLCNVNLTIFKLVLSWVGLCTALYGCITCIPIIRHDSPYFTPLSFPVWHVVTGIPFFVYRFLRWFNKSDQYSFYARHFQVMEESCRRSLAQGMWKTAEETALKLPSERDTRAFMWTFDCLDEDHELEHFFSGLPGFRSSNVVDDPLLSFTEEEKLKLYKALHGLLGRTFSSDLLPAPVKNRRSMICAKAVDPEHMPDAFITIYKILHEYGYSGPLATGAANILRGWGNDLGEKYFLYARFVISMVIGTRQPHDSSWYALASNELGIPEASLRDYAAHGDSLSLVILMHVVRQQFGHFGKPTWPSYDISLLLGAASTFNAQDTSPELQHDFCALWNQIVPEVQDCNDGRMAFRILGRIRSVYLALHQETDSAPTLFSTSTNDEHHILVDPSSYPVCKVPDHCSDSTPHIHDDDVPATIARTNPHDPNNTAFIPSLTGQAPPSSSTPAPLPVNDSLIDALPLDNPISVQSFTQPVGQTTTEACRIPTTSPSVTACTMHRSIDPSSRTMQPSTSSLPPDSYAAASPPDDVAVEHAELSRTPSDGIKALSSRSPMLVLDDILPTGLLLFLQAVTRSDLSFSFARILFFYSGNCY